MRNWLNIFNIQKIIVAMLEEENNDLNSHQTTFTFNGESSTPIQQVQQSGFDKNSIINSSVLQNSPNKGRNASKNKDQTLSSPLQNKSENQLDESPQFQALTSMNNTPNKREEIEPLVFDEDNPNKFHSYLQLTQKLQKALKQISSSKKTILTTCRNPEMLTQRFDEFEKVRKNRLQKKKEQIEYQMAKNLQVKPTINKNSQFIAKQSGYQPIHLRFQKIVEKKKKKFQQNEQLKKQQKEEEEERILQQIRSHQHRPQTCRSYDEYFNEMLRWKQKKQQQIKQKISQKDEIEKKDLTFHPQLTKKTIKLAQKKVKIPIYQKGLIRQKQKLEYSFQPNIHKKDRK